MEPPVGDLSGRIRPKGTFRYRSPFSENGAKFISRLRLAIEVDPFLAFRFVGSRNWGQSALFFF